MQPVVQSTILPIGESFGMEPRPYNRFAGNPPAGATPEEHFEEEMGFPYETETSTDERIDELQAQVDQQATVIGGLAMVTSSTRDKVQALEDTTNSLQASDIDHTTDINALESTTTSLDQRVDTLESATAV